MANDEQKPGTGRAIPSDGEAIVERVREAYAEIARRAAPSGCCGPAAAPCCGPGGGSTRLGYERDDLAAIPEGADLGLGCGAPIAHLELRAGETVLDLGSGAGVDAFLAARLVGSQGRVIGVDMTPEMIESAREHAARHGVDHVEFRRGRLESLPVDDASVDAVTSNCVINLVPDKARVFREIARVLRPGGRLVVADIVLDGELPDAIRDDVLAYVGCVAGAVPRERYLAAVAAAGLVDVEILEETDVVALGWNLAPETASAVAGRGGVTRSDLEGKVTSITLRAVRPQSHA